MSITMSQMSIHNEAREAATWCCLLLVATWVSLAPPTEARPSTHIPIARGAAGRDAVARDAARVEAFRQSVLGRMGLEREPRVAAMNTSLEETRRQLRLYRRSVEEQQGHTHDLYKEEDTRLLAKQYHNVRAAGRISGGGDVRLRVPVDLPQPDDANHELIVHSATLHLLRLYTQLRGVLDNRTVDQQVRVDVYQLLRSPRHHRDSQLPRKLLDSRLVNVLAKSSWENFDISGAVSDWLADPESNFGLEVSCSSGHVLSDVVKFALRGSRQAPRVSVYTQETQIVGRLRRSISPETYDCRQGDGEKRCCRYPLWISFKDIGWDKWVVQPDGYQAYFCDGSCPHSYKLAHNFASIKSLINLANPAASPGPCCTASKLSPLTLLHYNDHGQLIVSVYEDMIVEQCKCA